MIIVLDLSAPRKLSQSIINQVIFELKMNKLPLYKYRNVVVLVLLYIIIKNQPTSAMSTKELERQLNVKHIWDAIEEYGIPTTYFISEMLKMKGSIIQYYMLHFNIIKQN